LRNCTSTNSGRTVMGIAAVMLWVQLFQVLCKHICMRDLSSLSRHVHWNDCTWFHACWNAVQPLQHTLRHTATNCNTLQHAHVCWMYPDTHTLHAHCNTLQHIAKHYRAHHRWHYTQLPSPRALSSHTHLHTHTHTHLFLLALNVGAGVAVCILLLSVRTRAHTYTRTYVLAHTGVDLVVAHGGIYVHCWYYVERLGPLALYYLRPHCWVWVGALYSRRCAL